MRDGVLSDDSIKYEFPEYQPMNIGVRDAMEPVMFEKHGFTGIKVPKTYKYKRNPRFPIYDFTNFANMTDISDRKKTLYDATTLYRQKISKMKPAGTPVPFMSVNIGTRNKQAILSMNKAMRQAPTLLAKTENTLNTAIADNLINAQNITNKQIIRQKSQRSLDESWRENIYYGMGYNKQTEVSKVKQIMGTAESLPMSTVMLSREFRAGYGSAEDIALEDRYTSAYGQAPTFSIKPEHSLAYNFYGVRPLTPGETTLKPQLPRAQLDIDESLRRDMSYKDELAKYGSGVLPEGDLGRQIKKMEQRKMRDPAYAAEEQRLEDRMNELVDKERKKTITPSEEDELDSLRYADIEARPKYIHNIHVKEDKRKSVSYNPGVLVPELALTLGLNQERIKANVARGNMRAELDYLDTIVPLTQEEMNTFQALVAKKLNDAGIDPNDPKNQQIADLIMQNIPYGQLPTEAELDAIIGTLPTAQAPSTAPPMPPAQAPSTAPPMPPAQAPSTAPPMPPAQAPSTAPPMPPAQAPSAAPPMPPAAAPSVAPPMPPAQAPSAAPPTQKLTTLDIVKKFGLDKDQMKELKRRMKELKDVGTSPSIAEVEQMAQDIANASAPAPAPAPAPAQAPAPAPAQAPAPAPASSRVIDLEAQEKKKNFMKNYPPFKALNNDQKKTLAGYFEEYKVKNPGEGFPSIKLMKTYVEAAATHHVPGVIPIDPIITTHSAAGSSSIDPSLFTAAGIIAAQNTAAGQHEAREEDEETPPPLFPTARSVVSSVWSAFFDSSDPQMNAE